MSGDTLSVRSNIDIRGHLGLGSSDEFPANPRVGMLAFKTGVLYAYQTIQGVTSWYPVTTPTRSYVHYQGEARLQWNVNHQLGTSQQWYQVLDENGSPIYCTRQTVDENSFILTFTEPATGSCVVISPDSISVPSLITNGIDIGNGAVTVNSGGIAIGGSPVLTEETLTGLGSVFTTPAQVDARINAVVGTAPANLDTLGEISDKLADQDDAVAALVTTIAGKADAAHVHTIADVTNLQTTLNAKANAATLASVAFSGNYNDLSDKPAAYVPPVATSTVLGGVKIGANITVQADGTISVAPSPVQSVAGKTGVVTLAKADVGLGNVDNTSDANKPVSTATATALAGKAASVHSHAISDVTSLQTALDGKLGATAKAVSAGTADSANALNTANNYQGVQLAGIGAMAALTFGDRTTITNNWSWYSSGNVAYLYSNVVGNTGNRLTIDATGNFTAVGNVTAYSDERLKKDWAPLGEDIIFKLASIKSGTYTRIDSGERQVGVSAQDLKVLLPEAVMEDAEGTLSVAYGQAALALCIELAKKVTQLSAQVEELTRKLQG